MHHYTSSTDGTTSSFGSLSRRIKSNILCTFNIEGVSFSGSPDKLQGRRWMSNRTGASFSKPWLLESKNQFPLFLQHLSSFYSFSKDFPTQIDKVWYTFCDISCSLKTGPYQDECLAPVGKSQRVPRHSLHPF